MRMRASIVDGVVNENELISLSIGPARLAQSSAEGEMASDAASRSISFDGTPFRCGAILHFRVPMRPR